MVRATRSVTGRTQQVNSLNILAMDRSNLKDIDASKIDRLSSLPYELILLIFIKLRRLESHWGPEQPITSLVPLSRTLQHFQRIILYHTVVIGNGPILRKLQQSLQESKLGHLVLNLTVRFGYDTDKEFHQPFVFAFLDLLPSLRSIQCRTLLFGDKILHKITKFNNIANINLEITSAGSLIQLSKMQHLKEVALSITPYGKKAKKENFVRKEKVLRTLSLNKLSISGTISSLTTDFIQSIESSDITLDVCNDLPLALAAINDNLTRLSINNLDDDEMRLSNDNFTRFSHLTHLTFSQNVPVPSNFFTVFLATSSLQSLELKFGFRLNANDLIDALETSTSALQLNRIELAHLGGCYEGDWEERFQEWENSGQWDDLERLIDAVHKRGGIKLGGETIEGWNEINYRLDLSEEGLEACEHCGEWHDPPSEEWGR